MLFSTTSKKNEKLFIFVCSKYKEMFTNNVDIKLVGRKRKTATFRLNIKHNPSTAQVQFKF